MKINNKDTVSTWGARMGDGFVEALLSPIPMKEMAENKSAMEHGKQVFFSDKRDEREVTLTFFVEGTSPDDYLKKYRAFMDELSQGEIALRVDEIEESTVVDGVGTTLATVYRLIYRASASFALNRERTFGKVSIKFIEPNPMNRTEQ